MPSRTLLGLLLAGAALAQVNFESAARTVRPSLVSIITDKVTPARATDSGGPTSVQTQTLGSGFVLDTLGHILTCNHVVARYRDITVRFPDDKTYDGQDVTVVGQDPLTDLAVIQVKAKRRFTPAVLGNSSQLEVGQPVMALGSPFGLEGTATAGIISGLSRQGQPKSSGPDFQDFIQTDALVNPGNSGGPLVNTKGEVIGVSSFIRATRSGPTGIGFATPINLAKSVADQLIAHGRVIRGYLGISTQPITEGIRVALGLKSRDGVLVSAVEPGRPGAKAGILPGDAILTLDGQAIPDAPWFQSEVAGRKPGSSLRLNLLRRGEPVTVSTRLESWPVIRTGPARVPESGNSLGLTVRDACVTSPAPGEPECGALITAVESGSQAADAGLRADDLICEVNLAPVRDRLAFEQALNSWADSKRPLLLRVFRGRQAFYTTLEP